MIVFLSLVYVALLWALMKFKILPQKNWVWATIIPYELILLLFFFIPMQWGAPQGNIRTIAYSVQIVPNVGGQVLEINAEANEPLSQGDPIFTLDPTPYQAAVDGLEAQLALARTRLEQSEELARQQAGSVYEVQAYQAQVDGLEAQLDNARWNLDSTIIRAPADGYVTNLTLRPGARVAQLPISPSAAFIDTSELLLVAQFPQTFARHIAPGQTAEIAFKFLPGQVVTATVVEVLPANAQGQAPVSGFAPAPQSTTPGPVFVKLELDDAELAATLPVGAMGDVAIYTSEVQMAHVIRKVTLRMGAIMNYIQPS